MRAGTATRATGSNGWTLRCSCNTDRLGPYVMMLEQEWRGPQGLRHFLIQHSA